MRYFFGLIFLLLPACFAALAQASSSAVEIVAVGDISLDRGVKRRIEQFGFDYPFENVREILKNADLAFGNLENPLTVECEPAEKRFRFQGKPGYAKILNAAGFNILSLANNHSLDCGQIGLLETIKSLKKENLRWIGAGKTDAEFQLPLFTEIKKTGIAFLGFTTVSPGKFAEKSSGVALASVENVTRAVAAARQKSDVVIVSFHWGNEYASPPTDEQIRLAGAAVEAGADLILGHHPHVLQPFQLIEKQRGKRRALIAFSLGNFVFDSPVRLNKRTGESAILKIQIDKNGIVGAEVVPVVIENYRPVVAEGKKKQFILTRLNRLSEKFETIVENGRIVRRAKISFDYVERLK